MTLVAHRAGQHSTAQHRNEQGPASSGSEELAPAGARPCERISAKLAPSLCAPQASRTATSLVPRSHRRHLRRRPPETPSRNPTLRKERTEHNLISRKDGGAPRAAGGKATRSSALSVRTAGPSQSAADWLTGWLAGDINVGRYGGLGSQCIPAVLSGGLALALAGRP